MAESNFCTSSCVAESNLCTSSCTVYFKRQTPRNFKTFGMVMVSIFSPSCGTCDLLQPVSCCSFGWYMPACAQSMTAINQTFLIKKTDAQKRRRTKGKKKSAVTFSKPLRLLTDRKTRPSVPARRRAFRQLKRAKRSSRIAQTRVLEMSQEWSYFLFCDVYGLPELRHVLLGLLSRARCVQSQGFA